jgi:hypothetical protein
METLVVPPELRIKLGPGASRELTEMFAHYHQFSTDRFERRLTELDLGLRLEMERMRSDVIKWNLLFWIGQFTALIAVLSYMLDGR